MQPASDAQPGSGAQVQYQRPGSNARPLYGPDAAAWWVLLATFCSAAGWILSAFHALSASGYLIATVVVGGAGLLWAHRTGQVLRPRARLGRIRRRFRRCLPLSFLVLAALGFVGGALYPPNNWDALAYRVPRVLHWLAEGRWHWIHTVFQRVNLRGCAFEWVMAPLLALAKTDRLFFLLNFVSFCLMPGLLFSILRRLGINRRVAWCWMWILPGGYCFLLQAASLGNDFLAAIFALASVCYGLRARQDGRLEDLWVSMLAIALCTGVKANNLMLGLLWLVVVAPCWRLFTRNRAITKAAAGYATSTGWRSSPSPLWKGRGLGRGVRPGSLSCALLGTSLVAATCLLVSFLPTALLNQIYAGDWTGLAADEMRQEKAAYLPTRVLANVGVVLLKNLQPPVVPFAKTWNSHIASRLTSNKLDEMIAAVGEDAKTTPVFGLEELPTEETAGQGLGVCALLIASALAALVARTGASPRSRSLAALGINPPPENALKSARLVSLRRWVYAGTALAVGTFLLASLPSTFEARLMSAYYPFLALPFLALPGQAQVVRRRWWGAAALAVALAALLPLGLSPSRPLFPAASLLSLLREKGWAGSLVSRAEKVYAVYSLRAEGLESLTRLVPATEMVVGFIGYDDLETSLWKPFGARRVAGVCPGDSAARMRSEGIRYILVSPNGFSRFPVSFESWLQQTGAELVQDVNLTLRAASGPATWHIVKLK